MRPITTFGASTLQRGWASSHWSPTSTLTRLFINPTQTRTLTTARLRVRPYLRPTSSALNPLRRCPAMAAQHQQQTRAACGSCSSCGCKSSATPAPRGPTTAYVALGSNLGDRVGWIEKACREMDARGIRVKRTSSLWETEPMYVLEQDRFVNGACEVCLSLSKSKTYSDLHSR
jgi:2-amino-4-hydroxy-6-hydroxymethyldihydropteridine diphosphokinase/dihydropteroate synthase